jgi:hypothetical protein
MEYYLLMWNRSFEVSVTSSSICGAYVRGVISATSGSVVSARRTNDVTKLANPKRLGLAREHEPGSQSYLALHRFNFAIPRAQVAAVRFNPKPKWGMGPVPHSGRLHIDIHQGASRELILLGELDGTALVNKVSQIGYPIAPL